MKNARKNTLARVLTVVMVTAILVCCLLPLSAFATNEKVTAARAGVLQVNMIYSDENVTRVVNGGTGFLINDNTLITCHHCISLSDAEITMLSEATGKSVAEVRNRLSYSVTVSRDVTVPATIFTESYEMDFAVLRMNTSLQGRDPLVIRQSSTVQQTEQVYAIGFPVLPAMQQAYNTYTSDDATITTGVVNKTSIGVNAYSGQNTNYIMTSCDLDNGNSGGPMVDANGYVIGISQATWSSGGDLNPDFYYAIAIDQVTEVLDVLGVQYKKAGAEPEPTEPAEEPEEPATTAAPVEIEPATTAAPLTEPTTAPAPAKEGGNATLFIIIAAAVAVVIVVVVVVIIVVVGGNKKSSAPAPAQAMPPRPQGGAPIQGGFVPPTPVPAAPQPQTMPINDAGETTVLSQGAGETTVLSKNVNGGTLTRKRTGETVTINAEQFVVGRERKSVNYCISDNTSISRNHIRLNVRNGVTYLTDLNAANGTSVNGVKVMPRQEIALKSGDKITLADEDLEYKI